MPAGRGQLLATLARYAFRDKSVMLLTQGLGEQPFHNRIVVLVNEWTNSAAEMVANFATENRLATVVGEKTRGNVLGAMNFNVGGGYCSACLSPAGLPRRAAALREMGLILM